MMADWISIISLTLIGLVLIYLELVFVPGTTILGVFGLVLTGIGIYIAFEKYGTFTGYWVLSASFLVSLVALVYSFSNSSWGRFALKQQNKSHVNQGYAEGLNPEQRGTAISDLKPVGKAAFDDKAYEVTSFGNLIEAGEEVKIIRIDKNKIIVNIIS